MNYIGSEGIIIFALVLIIVLGFILYNLYSTCNNKDGLFFAIANSIKNIKNIFKNQGQNTNCINDILEIDNKNKIDNINNLIKIEKKKEVFNIDQNIFTYDEADRVCKAFNSKLATYHQLKEAYNLGADWCNYGWSANQMALYPTQKKTWKKLQKNQNTKNNCGNPGINGGYFSNTQLKLGVNCYGFKPEPNTDQITYDEKQSIENNNIGNNIEIDIDNIDIRPFNNNKWSEYSFKKSSYIINPRDYHINDVHKNEYSNVHKNEYSNEDLNININVNEIDEDVILVTPIDDTNKDPNIIQS